MIAAYGRALTPRQREVLAIMAEADDADDAGELVYERGRAFLDLTPVAARTVNVRLRDQRGARARGCGRALPD